jgi:hypothetical protein
MSDLNIHTSRGPEISTWVWGVFLSAIQGQTEQAFREGFGVLTEKGLRKACEMREGRIATIAIFRLRCRPLRE